MGQTRNAGALIRAMIALRNERRTGVLRVDAEGVHTFVYLLRGAPVFAEEGAMGETLGRLLVRQRVISHAQYVEIIERMARGLVLNEQMRFGEIAVELGMLSAEQVHRALADQVRWKIIRAFQREEPEWAFTDSESEVESVGRFVLPIESLVLDATRWFPDEQKYELVLAAVAERFPSIRGDVMLLAERFEITGGEMAFLSGLDGTRTLRALLESPPSVTEGVDVAALLAALVLVGALELASVKKDARMADAVSRAAPPALDKLSAPSRGPHPSTPPAAAATPRERATKAVLRLKAARDELRKEERERLKKPHQDPKKFALPPLRPTTEHEARVLAEQAFQKGKAHLRANQLALANAQFARARELDNTSIEYGLYATWSTSRLRPEGMDSAALETLRALARKAMKLDPNLAFAYYVLGHVALTEGAEVVARRCFQQALKIDPDAIDAERHIRILARREASPLRTRAVTTRGVKRATSQRPVPAIREPAVVVVAAPQRLAVVALDAMPQRLPVVALDATLPTMATSAFAAPAPPPAEDRGDLVTSATEVRHPLAGRRRALVGIGAVALVTVTAAVSVAYTRRLTTPRSAFVPADTVERVPHADDASASDTNTAESSSRRRAVISTIATKAAESTAPQVAQTSTSDAEPIAPAAPVSAASSAVQGRSPEPAGTTGRLLLPSAAAGHRIFIDDRVAGEGKADLVVSCGRHRLRIGSAGKPRVIEVPCGGDVNLKE